MSHIADMPTPEEFSLYQALVKRELGIHLPDQKRTMLGHRLLKRLRALGIRDYQRYYNFIISKQNHEELRQALELVTTNETFFFREPQHFEFVRENIVGVASRLNRPLRVWSAACATGEEAYSIAMTLSTYCAAEWELYASDVNESVLETAKKGIYLDDRTTQLSEAMRRRYCRRGTEEFEGFFRVIPQLRKALHFFKFNLMDDMSSLGSFDLVFLRNVLIYFDERHKEKILKNISRQLVPGGYLFIGHSESCHGLEHCLQPIKPAILQRAEQG